MEQWRPSCIPFSRAIYHHYRVCDVFGEFPRLSGLLDVDALCRQPIDQIVRTGDLELGIVGRRGDLYLDRQTQTFERVLDFRLDEFRGSAADIDVGLIGLFGKTMKGDAMAEPSSHKALEQREACRMDIGGCYVPT